MAVVQGTFGAFTDTENIAIDIADTLDMLDTTEVPLLSRVGKASLRKECVALKHEWLEGAMRGLDSAEVSLGTNVGTSLVVTTGDGVKFAAGDIILIESELLQVTGVATDTLTVTRGYGGSTAATHAATSVVSIVGEAWLTDADPGSARYTTVSNVYNYVQAFNDSMKVTSTQEAIEKYVRQGTMSSQLKDHMKVMWQTWERALWHGRKVAPDATTAGAMDGILVRIGNAYAKAGAALTEDMLTVAQRAVFDAGGSQHLTAFVNSFQKQAVSRLLDPYRQTSRTDTTAGTIVRNYESDFGTIEFVLDRNVPKDTIALLDIPRIGFGPFRGHAMKMLPLARHSGFYDTVQIFGQYTSEVHDTYAHAKITGLATS